MSVASPGAGPSAAVRTLVGLTVLAGAVSLASALLAARAPTAEHLAVAAGVTAATYALHRRPIVVHAGGSRYYLSLEEGGLYLALLILPPPLCVPMVAVAAVAAQAASGRALRKAAFNASVHTLSAGAAAAGFTVLVAFGTPGPAAAAAAVAAYTLLCGLLVSSLLARLEAVPLRRMLAPAALRPIAVAALLGMCLGAALYGLWLVHPLATAAAVPFLLLAGAYLRLSARADREAAVHRRVALLARDLVGVSTREAVAGKVAEACADLTPAGRVVVELRGRRPDEPTVRVLRDAEGGPSLDAPPLRVPLVGPDGGELGSLSLHPSNRTRSAFADVDEEVLRTVGGHAGAVLANVLALEEHRALWALHQSIVSNVPAGVLYLDGEGRIVYQNGHLARDLGAGGPDVGEQWLAGSASLHHHPDLRAAVAGALAGEPFSDLELECVGPSGEPLVLTASGVPIRASDEDAVTGCVLLVRDVTERRHAEERLLEIRRLRDVNEFKTGLLNTVSHELNTPLTPITLQVRMLRSTPLNEKQGRMLDMVDRNVARLQALLRDLLDMGKLEAGSLRLQPVPHSLDALARDAHDSFAPVARARGVTISLAGGAPALATFDPQRMGQVLDNLLSNSLAYTPEGGTIEVETREEAGRVRLTVRDSGAGMTAEQIERLFQPFSQVQGARQKGGTGLGLYICRGIVERHGGRIWCESGGPGMGAAFHVELPRERAAPAQAPAAGPTPS